MESASEYYAARETWRDWRVEANLLIRLAHIAPGKRVLEVGCGGGGLVRSLGHSVFAVGTDISGQALALAQTRESSLSPQDRRTGFVQTGADLPLPFASESFDAILGQHVIEHLRDAPSALIEFKRVLKKGGWLALATPNSAYPDPAHFADIDHVHIFTACELVQVVSQSGLRPHTCFTIFPYLSRARLLRLVSVVGYRVFRRTPYFSTHGRTIVLGARNL